jgi:hypothetical protein
MCLVKVQYSQNSDRQFRYEVKHLNKESCNDRK